MQKPRRDGEREHGQIIVLFALVLVVILAFAAIVVDLGVLRNNRQILVNTFDSAALAGGKWLPVNGAAEASDNKTLIDNTIQANYPGLPTSAYTITYKCLVGADATGPLISRDVPAVCNPAKALGHTPPVPGDFTGAGPTRVTSCRPDLGDLCNVVVIAGSANTPFSLGPVVGVTQGSTGTVVSAACNGPCGASPVIPVDLVIILDRTLSMQGNDSQGNDKITSLQSAAYAVLKVSDQVSAPPHPLPLARPPWRIARTSPTQIRRA
jgi:Flp pilus assembly protein TadG